jgi:hypothetical protein
MGVRLLTPLTSGTPVPGYLLFGRNQTTPAEIMCSLDPFAYVSHLSAMEYHGLTDRFPQIVYMTTPAAADWRKQAQARMERDLGTRLQAYRSAGLPRLLRPHVIKLEQTHIEFHERSQLGAFRHVADTALRVATLGRVVVDIYRQEASRHLKLIVDEVDRHGQPIDKVRAGFVLAEVCRLQSPVIDGWDRFAQRGGSRKLDAESEYAPIYSERWQLSINVPSIAGAALYDQAHGHT